MPHCTQTCNLDPFNSVVTPESSDVEILRTELEDYLRRFRDAVCADFTCVEQTRVYYISADGLDGTASVTAVAMAMDSFIMAATGVVNPSMPVEALAVNLSVDWAVSVHTVSGNWTLSLFRNETELVATFVMTEIGVAGLHQKVFGPWVPVSGASLLFQPGDTWHLEAAGPEKNFVIIRAILRFEEA